MNYVPGTGRCSGCKHYVTGWHRGCTGGVVTPGEPPGTDGDSYGAYNNILVREAGMPDEVYEAYVGLADYYERLSLLGKIAHKLKPRDLPAEWRQPPGYPNYILHSVTRELWRHAYEIRLPNGNVRRYPAKLQKPINGSYSLSVDGVRSSRGVRALYLETFPEAGKPRKRKRKGEWAGEIRLHRNELDAYPGLEEWLAGDTADIVTRPK